MAASSGLRTSERSMGSYTWRLKNIRGVITSKRQNLHRHWRVGWCLKRLPWLSILTRLFRHLIFLGAPWNFDRVVSYFSLRTSILVINTFTQIKTFGLLTNWAYDSQFWRRKPILDWNTFLHRSYLSSGHVDGIDVLRATARTAPPWRRSRFKNSFASSLTDFYHVLILLLLF